MSWVILNGDKLFKAGFVPILRTILVVASQQAQQNQFKNSSNQCLFVKEELCSEKLLICRNAAPLILPGVGTVSVSSSCTWL